MDGVATDTHALIWYFLDQERLSEEALSAFDQAGLAGNLIYISAISIVEMCYLVEKRKIPTVALDRLHAELGATDPLITVVPLDDEIAWVMRQIPRDHVPEMPDRIIAATALYLDLPLVTRDLQIRTAPIRTIW